MRLITVLMVLFCLTTAAFAQEQTKLFVVRDDDGTADDGRGQVSGPNSVARKTLQLDRDPVGINRAWIMYYMKHNPYDVATKTLYREPVEGVKWSNLDIKVNGRQVLLGSLIEHGTEGWHEAPVDPGLLVRGDNQVDISLDGHGSYFYLGIDRAAPQGRSASSENGGKTFRPRWLSFGKETADDGEYMVRLKIEAAAPAEVGFTERDGQQYGWLEFEDLFSTTRPHASGCKAIPWTKGVNRPSGDLVAHCMAGGFETGFDIPADGQWRVWLRGWMDGFRGGGFTLTWDGKPFYSSSGKHEFSSDAQLRLDWLDLGAVALTKGRHVLGVTATGECGHMFDTLVLTTDPAYKPDESQPLPRMTKIEKLVAPEGLSSLLPGPYMTENPIPWGRPLAGGPLKTLWVCGGINEREITELQQRLDLQADVISSPVVYYGQSIFGQDLNMDQADLLYDLLTADKHYDVAVLVRTKLSEIPDHAAEELLRRVREGMGLIVVRSMREDEAETKLSAVLKDAKPVKAAAFAAPFDMGRQVSVSAMDYGDGRILVKSYTNWGMLDQLKAPPTDLRYPYWEYQFGHWARLLMQAGKRDTGRLTGLSVPEVATPGQPAQLAVTAAGGTQVSGCVWAPNEQSWRKFGPVPCAGQATIPLAAAVEDGLYHVQVSLRNAEGQVLDAGIVSYRVEQPARLAEVQADWSSEPGGQAAVTMKTANAVAAVRLPVRVEVFGSHERLLGSKQATLEVAAGEGEAAVTVPVIGSFERLLEARVTVGEADKPPLQRLQAQFLRPQKVALDDYISTTSTHTNRECPTYCWPVYGKIFADMGMKANYPGGMFGSMLEQGFSSALVFRMTDVGSSTTGPGDVRVPCLHDPEMWAQEEQTIRERARLQGRYSPLVLGLGDEMGISHHDEVCFSEHTLAAFRQYLQQQYGTIEKLNATWQTEFANWQAVVPWKVEQVRGRPANIAPWLEFRVFMTRTFVDALVKMQQWVKDEAPAAYTGGANPLSESHTSCSIFSQIYPALEYAQVYPRFHDRARSWFRDPRLVGLWSGYGYDRPTTELHAWLLPAYGGTLMAWYGAGREADYNTLTDTLNFGEPGKTIRDCNLELQSGIGKLLIAAAVEPEPVAIVSSYRSKYAYTALKASQTPQINPTGWNQEFDEFLQGYSALLRKLRVPYRFVDEDQIERGELDKFRLVIAPQVSVLSDAAVEKLRAYAAQHPVIADQALATHDERGVQRPAVLLNVTASGTLKLHDFGDRPLQLTDENVARLKAIVEAAGIAPTDEVSGGDIDFIVRKRLGDLRMLVVFGKGVLSVKPPAGMVAYDARSHKLLGAAPTTLTQQRSPAVVVFAPRQVGQVTLAAPAAVQRGEKAALSLQLANAPQSVVRLTVTGPDGKPRPWYDANVTISEGKGAGSFQPALNDATGKWTFTATDVISGAQATATLTVK